MKSLLIRIMAFALALALPSLAFAQATDRSEMDQWLKASEHQGDVPIGTHITMSNWQQYKQFMPFGMVELFQGQYGWKMPADVEIDIGPSHEGGNLPKSWVEATEKYGTQTGVQVLPNGHYLLKNYQGGTPFPNPQEPYKGWKIMANVFYAYAPVLYIHTPSNYGTVWAQDKYGNIAPSSIDVVYRWSDFIVQPGFQRTYNYAPGTWYTEWITQETPEQARYTASLSLYYSDQESHPFPDSYVFVPALRRSLRLSTTARCSPLFGWEWTYDDAKFNGFNGSTATYTADYLGDRRILNLTLFDGSKGGDFPGGWDMPLGFPKPSWGKWELRHTAIADVHRIPSEAAGYCYSSRILYADREFWSANWVDLYDSNRKLWKTIAYYNQIGDVPGMGFTWKDIAESTAWDLQNVHATIWSSYGNPSKRGVYLNNNAPREYMDGVKYGSPSGLMQILR
jgi:Protein of unknown function (DUF1329)